MEHSAESGTIEAPIGRDAVKRKNMAIGGSGAREARTHFTVVERLSRFQPGGGEPRHGAHSSDPRALSRHRASCGWGSHLREKRRSRRGQAVPPQRPAAFFTAPKKHLDLKSPLPDDLATVLERLRVTSAAGAGC